MKFNEILNTLTFSELQELKFDIANDAEYLQKLVNTKIANIENINRKTCAGCGVDCKEDAFTLIFGPSDFRKKGSFCSMECLEMFTYKLRSLEIKH